MGAHSPATLTAALERVTLMHDWLAARPLDDTGAHWWADRITEATYAPRTAGTLKEWMQAHNAETVHTLQVTVDCGVTDQLRPGSLWVPGRRRIDAARATRVVLDGSTREYAGVTTTVATSRTYIGFAKWGTDAVQMLVYVTEDRAS